MTESSNTEEPTGARDGSVDKGSASSDTGTDAGTDAGTAGSGIDIRDADVDDTEGGNPS